MSGQGRRLTCHVLDASLGLPAAGVGLTLSRVDGPSPRVLVRTTTNADGRTDEPLLAGEEPAPGRYLLEVAIGAYFAPRPDLGAMPYLDIIPIRFGVEADRDHTHVALLVTPWSYTTYRGS